MTSAPRLAEAGDVDGVARLLHAFNEEFAVPSPGVTVLAARLNRLLSAPTTFAVVAGAPVDCVALVTLRTNVWTDGFVALLDELYTVPAARNGGLGSRMLAAVVEEARRRGATDLAVEVDEPDVDAQRFYARHGLPVADPGTGDRALLLWRELG